MTSEAAALSADVRVLGRRVELPPHNCFACGQLNAHGLHLGLHAADGRCWTELSLPERFEGWEGIAHGGIVCTLLDEVMAWALVEQDSWGVTARMAVDFRRPVRVGRPIRAEGWVVHVRRRILDTAGRVVDVTTGEELATAAGVYVAASDERKAELKARYGFVLRDEEGGLMPAPAANLTPAPAGSGAKSPAAHRPSDRPPGGSAGRTAGRTAGRAVDRPADRPASPTTERARALVAQRRPIAKALGRSLAELAADPDAFVDALRAGLADLADPEYREAQSRVAPGIGPVLGVRWPLLAAT